MKGPVQRVFTSNSFPLVTVASVTYSNTCDVTNQGASSDVDLQHCPNRGLLMSGTGTKTMVRNKARKGPIQVYLRVCLSLQEHLQSRERNSERDLVESASRHGAIIHDPHNGYAIFVHGR